MKVKNTFRAKAALSAVPQEAQIYPWWHNVIAGAAAGAGARLFTAPLDLIKIRRQLQITTPATSTASVGASTGIFHSLKRIVKTEGGIQSLFRGNLAATYLWIGYAAVQFSLYARTADFLSSFPPDIQMNHLPIPIQKPAQFASDILFSIGSNPTAVAFCAGATAGTAATLATYPFDICRTAFASQKTLSQGTKSISTFFQLAMKDNPHPLRTVFAGSGPAVLGIIPYMGLNFALYDYLVRTGDRVKVSDAGTAGAISGGVSKLIVYPLDTVKKRLQAQSFDSFWGSRDVFSKRVPYTNMIDCGSRIMREEGLSAFYRGLVPTVLKTMVATSLTFAIFQMTKNNLENFYDWRTGPVSVEKAHSKEKRQ
jgi:solute carrier family 25 thiamine pyrophosphate transporter 19